MSRVMLMIEVDGEDARIAAQRVEQTLPDVHVWGEVDAVQAALLVMPEPVAAA